MRLYGRSAAGLAILALSIPLMSTGCSAPDAPEGFAIYLTKDNVPPSQMEMLSHVELADEPFIAMDDIVSYDASTHEMTLTEDAIQRIEALQVPTSGKSFVVCVDRGPLYWGAFWVQYSSQSFDGVTIWLPLGVQDSTIVTIELGYPSFSFYQGEDPRNNPLVLASLEQAGKLIVRPPVLPTGALPQSLKGYELYSWQEGDDWHFTLVTGTNRNKTVAEILSREPLVTGDGWVHIHATGVDELKGTLSRIPAGEFVMWFSQFYGEGGESITLPPQDIVEDVASHAAQRGLDFNVLLH